MCEQPWFQFQSKRQVASCGCLKSKLNDRPSYLDAAGAGVGAGAASTSDSASFLVILLMAVLPAAATAAVATELEPGHHRECNFGSFIRGWSKNSS
jgi:hypothetical protein